MRKLIYKSLASILCVSLVWSSREGAQASAHFSQASAAPIHTSCTLFAAEAVPQPLANFLASFSKKSKVESVNEVKAGSNGYFHPTPEQQALIQFLGGLLDYQSEDKKIDNYQLFVELTKGYSGLTETPPEQPPTELYKYLEESRTFRKYIENLFQQTKENKEFNPGPVFQTYLLEIKGKLQSRPSRIGSLQVSLGSFSVFNPSISRALEVLVAAIMVMFFIKAIQQKFKKGLSPKEMEELLNAPEPPAKKPLSERLREMRATLNQRLSPVPALQPAVADAGLGLSPREMEELLNPGGRFLPGVRDFFNDKNHDLTWTLWWVMLPMAVGVLFLAGYTAHVFGHIHMVDYLLAHGRWTAGALVMGSGSAIALRVNPALRKPILLLAAVMSVFFSAYLWLQRPMVTPTVKTSIPAATTPAVAPNVPNPAPETLAPVVTPPAPTDQQEVTPPAQQTQQQAPADQRPILKKRQKPKEQPVLPAPVEKPQEIVPPRTEEAPIPVPAEPPKDKTPAQLLPLLQAAEKQDGEILDKVAAAEKLKPGEVQPIFSVALAGSLEKHPDFMAIGPMIVPPPIPLPHKNPKKKHQEEIDALARERATAEKLASEQEVVKVRGQAALDYIQARERQETLDALVPLTQHRSFLWVAEFEAQRGQARADVLQKQYALLAELSVPSDTDLSLKSSDALLAELSDDMREFVGRASGLDVAAASEAKEQVHFLSDVHWYHRWLTFKSVSENIMLNARGLSLWGLLSGGLNMQTYEKLDLGKEAETVRTALANLQALRTSLRKEILDDLKILKSVPGERRDLDFTIKQAQAAINDSRRSLENRRAAWEALLKASQERTALASRVAAARIRLQFRGVPAASIPEEITLEEPEMDAFATKQADYFLDPFQTRLNELQAFAATLPPPPASTTPPQAPSPGHFSITGTPPGYGYVDGANRNNPAVPEIAPNKLTLGTGATLTFPQSNPNSPPVTATAGISQAGHKFTLGSVTIGPNLPAKGAEWLVHKFHHKKNPSTPDPTKVPVMAGVTAQADPMFLLTGKPWYPDFGVSYSVSYDPAVRQSAKEKAAKARWERDLANRVEQLKKDTEAETIPLLPRANDTAIQALAHRVVTTTIPAEHGGWHMPYINITSGDATWRARFFSLTGTSKPFNIYRHPKKMKEAEEQYKAALKPLDDLRQQVAEQKMSYVLKGLILVAEYRWEAYETAQRTGADQNALEEAKKNYVNAIENVKAALATVPDEEQHDSGLHWEPPPSPPVPPAPTEPVKESLQSGISAPAFSLLGILGVVFMGFPWRRREAKSEAPGRIRRYARESGLADAWNQMIRDISRLFKWLWLKLKSKPQPQPVPVHYLSMFDKKIPEEQAREWLQRVLGLQSPPPLIEGLMELFNAERNWNKAVRFAYQLKIDGPNTAPTEEEIAFVGAFFAKYRETHPGLQATPENISDMAAAVVAELGSTEEFKSEIAKKHDQYIAFAEATITVYVFNDAARATELVQEHILTEVVPSPATHKRRRSLERLELAAA